jgi:hypothetical protein
MDQLKKLWAFFNKLLFEKKKLQNLSPTTGGNSRSNYASTRSVQ